MATALIDGSKLRAARKAAGLSQAKAAAAINLGNPDLIREYEKGARVPAGGVLIRLLLLYRVQPSQVVRYESGGGTGERGE